jgi:hydrogenase nickel incorporation protein HypB
MPRILDVRTQILKKNDVLAREMRERFRTAGVFVVSLVSSPGSGKTSFLTETLRRLLPTHRVAALVGDLSTENDARRLATSGAPVRQIVTGTVCHLEAEMVFNALGLDLFPSSGTPGEGKGGGSGISDLKSQIGDLHPNPPPEYRRREQKEPWDLNALDILFIENVGNLVCPSSYDLGEDLRLVLLSTTEGEDKPLKYPTIFNTADMAVITKQDLAEVVGFDRAAVHENIQNVRPGMPVIEVSARTGFGMEAWLAELMQRCSLQTCGAP